ncbi:hypothetical protein CARUB_v10006221mg [Capsella rubella]|uniref:S-protein homolog n=1 Tax=Capsella rubella TaxID=81985 RepID=R0GZR8_9BRAS|nr:hypothetical protein CARUB_v10006221mg [Capsella rubella]
MKSPSKKFVVFSIIFCYLISSCHGFTLFPKTVVTVTNNIIPQTPLTISCKSRDDDLGEHVLLFGEGFQWKFRPAWFRQTFFTCKFVWNNQTKWFDTYRPDREKGNCLRCYWSIKADGPCISGYFDKHSNRCFPWN